MRFTLFFLTLFSSFHIIAQKQSLVTIEGIAPAFIGQEVFFNEIEDYLSMHEVTIASSKVTPDSLFNLSFELNETKKLVVKIGNNTAHLYAQPGGHYRIYFPLKNSYGPFRPAGNQVEVTFFDLDSSDVNYRILAFNKWMDNYLALNHKRALTNPTEFAIMMDSFKLKAQERYIKDTNTFFFDYVKYTIANSIDNIQSKVDRNRFEKYDQHLKGRPVLYQNDAYMDYFNNFYKGIMQTIPMEVNNRVYLGLLKSSPSLIMNALGLDYTLKTNLKERELVMIKLLSEIYYQKDYPQTNVAMVLDSLQKFAIFEPNRLVAKNILNRLTQVTNGGKAPDFFVKTVGENKLQSLADYKGKYLYIHYFDPNSEKSKAELPVLINLYEKYKSSIEFLTIIKESAKTEKSRKILSSIPWNVTYAPDRYEEVWQYYKVATFPQYVLIDPYQYVVQSPALGPMPNSLYETIDKVFYSIHKVLLEEKEKEKRN